MPETTNGKCMKLKNDIILRQWWKYVNKLIANVIDVLSLMQKLTKILRPMEKNKFGENELKSLWKR